MPWSGIKLEWAPDPSRWPVSVGSPGKGFGMPVSLGGELGGDTSRFRQQGGGCEQSAVQGK